MIYLSLGGITLDPFHVLNMFVFMSTSMILFHLQVTLGLANLKQSIELNNVRLEQIECVSQYSHIKKMHLFLIA